MAGGQWRRDPTGRHEFRWWDGERFTEYVGDDGVQSVDPGPIPGPDQRIDAGFASLVRQNRWSVGFRVILAIPHLIWLTVVSIGAFFVVMVGWFAALFIGRLPHRMAGYLSRVLRYYVRVISYLYLMQDDYPPFNLRSDEYAVTVATHPGTLNRWSVLFRFVLLFPVYLLASWVAAGVGVSMIVVWIIVLAKGRMPAILAQAIAAILRFEARTYGFGMMVSSTYPGGLYGDDPDAPLGTDANPAADPDAPAPPTAAPRTGRLVLAKGARRLVTLFLVLGILQWGVSNAFNVTGPRDPGATISASVRTPGSPGR